MTETCDKCNKPAYPEGDGQLYTTYDDGEKVKWCRGCCWSEGIWDEVKDQRRGEP